ncbi:MAG: hypothetical protein GY870_18545 [archaeon]|nr:hypothetical protein [archaeon]
MSKPIKIKSGLAGAMGTLEEGRVQILAQCHDHTIALTGTPASKFYFDAKTNCEDGALVSGYYGIDSVAIGIDAYNIEIEALGGAMVYGKDSMPTIDFRKPLIKNPEDLQKLKNKKVDFQKDGRFPFILELNEYMVEYGFTTELFCSPLSMAVGMRGFPGLVKDMRKKPEFVHELFKFIVDDVILPWLTVQKDYNGNLMAIGADAWAAIPNFSVGEMKKWAVPYNIRLMDKALEAGILVTNVTGDYCEERIEKFDKDILHGSFDVEIESQGQAVLFLAMGRWFEYPLEAVREYTKKFRDKGQTVILTAGLNAKLLRDGPVEKIVDNVKRFIDAFARDHDLSILLANIPADAPSDHIHAAVAAVHTYGKFPIADNLDEVEFNLPKRESYDEWKKNVNKPFPKTTIRKGLANLLWKQLGSVNEKDTFKKIYANSKFVFMYDLTDQTFATLITVENGVLDIKSIDKRKEKSENYEIDAGMKCSTKLFFDFGAGKLSKLAILGKIITGKLKISGAKKMQELQKIMAL